MNDSLEEIYNFRAPRFWLARTQGTCGRCRAPLRLFALAVPPGHETLEVDDDAAVEAVEAVEAGEAGEAGEADGWAVDEGAGVKVGETPGGEAGKTDDQAGHAFTPSALETWQIAEQPAFLFHVESVPVGIRTLLSELAPSYRIHPGEPHDGEGWANHCDRCGSMQDDQALFCEPEGAFARPTKRVRAASRSSASRRLSRHPRADTRLSRSSSMP
jgi:hypothetical protein